MPIKHRVNGADRRCLDIRVPTLDPITDLGRTPSRVLALQLHDETRSEKAADWLVDRVDGCDRSAPRGRNPCIG